jgi:NADPH:quinone reductase-like Zn-dependent oxidoreductase
MKAIRIHEPTGISGLVYEEAPDPTPMLCEVLVKVAACGITHNELDGPIWTCRAGHPRTSIIPGSEVSGVIAALGLGTGGVAVSEEVFGLTDQFRDGRPPSASPSKPVTWPPKPRTVDHMHAAALPRAGLTAWQALFDHLSPHVGGWSAGLQILADCAPDDFGDANVLLAGAQQQGALEFGVQPHRLY